MKIKQLSKHNIFCALVFGVLWGGLLYKVTKSYTQPLVLIFLLIISHIFAILAWRIVAAQGYRQKIVAAAILLVSTGLFWLKTRLQPDASSFEIEIFLAEMALILATIIATQFYILRFTPSDSAWRDHDFYGSLHNLLISAVIYLGFALLSLVILALGFSLLSLLNIHLWDLLGHVGQALFIGLVVGANLLLLNLIRPYVFQPAPPFLLVFPAIVMAFSTLYLVALLFLRIETIDSVIRLSMALTLFLMSLLIYNKNFYKFNAFSATIGIILTLVSLHGLCVRVEEYALTVNRIVIIFIAVLLLIGHVSLLIKSLLTWKNSARADLILPLTMVIFAAAMIAIAIAPLTRLALKSQVALYTTGGKSPAHLDPYLFAPRSNRTLNAQALEEIRQYYQQHDPEKLAIFEEVTSDKPTQREKERQSFFSKITRLPADLVVPENVQEAIKYMNASDRENPEKTIIFAIDANHDGKNEFVVIAPINEDFSDNSNDLALYLFAPLDRDEVRKQRFFMKKQNIDKVKAIIEAKKWQYRRPDYDHLVIEGLPVIPFSPQTLEE